MSRVRQHGTWPELRLASVLSARGHRFQTQARELPGSPDFFDPTAGVVIFVHGCFWHRHAGCRACTTPKHNRHFWLAKFCDNIRRDRRNARRLRHDGYAVLTAWECQLKDEQELLRVVARIERVLAVKHGVL